jgi:5'-3' exonuclease
MTFEKPPAQNDVPAIPNNAHNLMGRTFGRLEVVAHAGRFGNGKHKYHAWRVQCKCNGPDSSKIVYGADLVSGKTPSCGCIRRGIVLEGVDVARWLVLDVSFLCWRVFHSSLKKLSYKEIPTGVMFGFMRDLLHFQEVHRTTNVAFCFDSRHLIRKDVLPSYKSTREKKREQETTEEKKSRQGLMDQIVKLRTTLLPEIGFKNICYAEGYEADDVIASLCQNKREQDEFIIISSDKDLLQLLQPTVSIWEPKGQNFTTVETFRRAWGVPPRLWALVKAISGCNTDDIPGIDGVAEKTAIRFIKRQLNKKTTTYSNIKSSKQQVKDNLPLVRLPYEGTPSFVLQKDEIDATVWDGVLGEYGMRSLRTRPPKLKRRGFHEEEGGRKKKKS